MTTPSFKLLCALSGGFLVCISYLKARNPYDAYRATVLNSAEEKLAKLTKRERRFVEFASAEYAGQIYMTPRDFLESVLEREPKPCLRRKILTNDEISHFHAGVPSVQYNTCMMFRKLSNSGIISFADYLFLLSVLTRPEGGFRIAFEMFDTDGNQQIEHDEFIVIRQILGRSLKERKTDDDTRKTLIRLMPKNDQSKLKDYNDVNKNQVDAMTTLQIHFFGEKGTDALSYAHFYQFMKHLQQEVLQIEFERYAKGRDYISDEEFAFILLNYTHLKPHQYGEYLKRIENLEERHPVTYEQFEGFCQVLHNLDDFSVAMRFFYSVKKTISKDEFAHAVRICSGSKLGGHIIDVVFALFDEDCDGLVSYSEFFVMMKNKSRFRCGYHPLGAGAFKRCLRREMKRHTR
ncbi:calcium uptake protein 3, mitochondrial-like [Ochlerotatus camptorhynchus]|uniref:calcium uptake protein 3, mitochondrial-like n=1 Tax=Ochlerotatus camptorhynchus TaxID=644619 RepID=UPI0031D164A4